MYVIFFSEKDEDGGLLYNSQSGGIVLGKGVLEKSGKQNMLAKT